MPHATTIETLIRLSAVALLPTLACVAHAGDEPAGPGESPRFDDRVIVRLDDPFDPGALNAFVAAFEARPELKAFALSPIDSIAGRGIHLLELSFDPGTPLFPVEAALENGVFDAHLQWGEFLYGDDAPEGANGTTGSTYVDSIAPPAFGNQYAAGQLKLAQAHDRSTGAVTVAVLDTGIDPNHPVFGSAVLPGFDFVDGDTDATETANGIDDDGDGVIDEMYGHGTYVAGLIRFVAPNARILPIRVLDDEGNGTGWPIIQGLFAAIDSGVEVINVSIRSTYDAQAVEDAVDEARSLGIAVVAAAGNFGIDRREFPAAKSSALGVIAVDDADVKADFSSFNDKMFICAPGDTAFAGGTPDLDRAIVSALPGGDFGAWEGTSFATPMVAGAAALIRAQHPEWQPNAGVVDQIEVRMAAGAVNIAAQNPGIDPDDLGVGRLDVAAAVGFGPIAPGVGDIDASGAVDFGDLARVIADWGLVHSSADIDGDGVVGVGDLLTVLGRWD
ncbi:MAG: S8 family serine peptidase [Phycisphaerales bacterium]